MSANRHRRSQLITAVGNPEGPVNPASRCQTSIFPAALTVMVYLNLKQSYPLIFHRHEISVSERQAVMEAN